MLMTQPLAPPSRPQPLGGAQTGLLARPTAEMHKAPLIARVHMRMGIWRWTVTEVCQPVCSCCHYSNASVVMSYLVKQPCLRALVTSWCSVLLSGMETNDAYDTQMHSGSHEPQHVCSSYCFPGLCLALI